MQRRWLLALVVLVLVAAALLLLGQKNIEPADTATWNNFTDPDTGFSISYPLVYAVDVSEVATGTTWGSRSMLSIYDPSDKSMYEFHVGPASVILQRQPTEADGAIYHTIAEYAQSGAADRSIQGLSPPKGQLVSVNGT